MALNTEFLNATKTVEPTDSQGYVHVNVHVHVVQCTCTCVGVHIRVPVRHANDKAVHSALIRVVNDLFHGWNEYLTAFNTKSLLTWPLQLEKVFKHGGPYQPC